MSAPQSNDAAFRYTEDGQVGMHYLGTKLRRPVTNVVQRVSAFQPASLSASARRVAIGDPAYDLTALIRRDGNPQALLDFLAALRRGATADYFPSLASPALSFPCELVDAPDVALDEQFWHDRRFEVPIRLRRTDGGTWQSLIEEPLFYWKAGNAFPSTTFTRTGTASQIDEAGLLTAVAANKSRVDWINGLPDQLLEDDRENLCLQSEDLSTTWVLFQATADANADTAPDGATTADGLIESTDAGVHYVRQDFTKAASSLAYAFSCFVKANGRDEVQIRLHGASANDHVLAEFDLGDGSVSLTATAGGTGWTAGTAGIEQLPDSDWYWCWLTGTSDTATEIHSRVYVMSGGATSYTGDGSSGLLVWGGQLEQASSPSSYVPTTTVAVTRGVETWSAPFVHPPQALTAYGKVTMRTGASETGYLLNIGAAALADPRLSVRRVSSTQFRAVYDNGVDPVNSEVTATPTIGQSFEWRAVLYADGSILLGISIEEGAESLGSQSSAPTDGLKPTWAGGDSTLLYQNSLSGSDHWLASYRETKVLPGEVSLASCRTA